MGLEIMVCKPTYKTKVVSLKWGTKLNITDFPTLERYKQYIFEETDGEYNTRIEREEKRREKVRQRELTKEQKEREIYFKLKEKYEND